MRKYFIAPSEDFRLRRSKPTRMNEAIEMSSSDKNTKSKSAADGSAQVRSTEAGPHTRPTHGPFGTAPGGRTEGLDPVHPLAALPPDAERLDVARSGPPQGMIRIIQRFAAGERSTTEFRELHQYYSAIAESTVRREEIPLTRRDYIRRYFDALRPE